jgi:hypothetical protein
MYLSTFIQQAADKAANTYATTKQRNTSNTTSKIKHPRQAALPTLSWWKRIVIYNKKRNIPFSQKGHKDRTQYTY